MTNIDFDGLEQASASLSQWFKEHCDPHMAIIIDANGVRVISEECGMPSEKIINADQGGG